MATTYKFGSFNLKNFGRAATAKDVGGITKRDFEKIADIIRTEDFDVVAFQEILSEGYALKNNVAFLLPGWEIKCDVPRDSSDPTKCRDKRGEGFAIAWNTKRLKLASSITDYGIRTYEPRFVNDAVRYDCRIFARNPYYARFVPVNGGFFEFRVINVHLHFGNNSNSEIARRKQEYDFLVQRVYPSLSMERRYGNNREAYTIIMGDYNLNLYKPRGMAEVGINKNSYIDRQISVGTQTIVTVQDELSTLKSPETDEGTIDDNPTRGYSQNYDHFTYDKGRFEDEGIIARPQRIDAVRKYCGDDFEMYHARISDHVPVSLEIVMNVRTMEVTNDGNRFSY